MTEAGLGTRICVALAAAARGGGGGAAGRHLALLLSIVHTESRVSKNQRRPSVDFSVFGFGSCCAVWRSRADLAQEGQRVPVRVAAGRIESAHCGRSARAGAAQIEGVQIMKRAPEDATALPRARAEEGQLLLAELRPTANTDAEDLRQRVNSHDSSHLA